MDVELRGSGNKPIAIQSHHEDGERGNVKDNNEGGDDNSEDLDGPEVGEVVVFEAVAHPDAQENADEEEGCDGQLNANVEVIALLQEWVHKLDP